jgi:putative transcriptional regulator
MAGSLRGHYLIAGKRLRDSNFYKTVVLMVEHGDEGAMGLVVNRPSTIKVAHALAEHFSLPESEEVVYLGGPVEPAALFILHSAEDLDQDESPVVPGVFVGSNARVFERVVQSAADGREDLRFRIFSGCAGWAPGQLESEIARGDWYVRAADAQSLYECDPFELWDEQVAKIGAMNRLFTGGPENPEWN